MEEVMMIPSTDFEQLVQYCKGELTENALLNKTARLAAENHVLLTDKTQPAALVNAYVKPLAHKQAKLTKQLRQFPMGSVGTDMMSLV